MKKIILLFGFACLQMAISLAQTPDGFNYQGVTRNSTGTILLNQAISLRMSILQGSASGTTVYCETHAATSNDYGVFDLVVGNGAVISGNFSTIDWGADIYFMKVEMDGTGGTNYEFMGTSQLLSVPYALHAKTAENVTGTITESDPVFTAWDKTTGISITENQVSDLQNYLTAEVDGSVTNELQVLSISDDTIYLSNGGFVKLPAGFDGQYSSLTGAPSLATVATSGSYNDLNDQPAIPANVSELNNDTGYLITEVDGSVTNELQALSISNDTIYLSNGGFVKLPAGFSGNYNDLTNKPDFTGWDTNDANDFNGDYNNLTNTPTIPANVSQLTNDAGYITGFTEVDGSVTNELQALSISNDTVYLSNGGFVKLPAGFSGNYNDLSDKPDLSGYLTQEADTMLWKKNGNDIFYNTGNVGIGQEDTYGSKLTVVHNDSNWVARLYNSSTFGKNYGLYIAAGTNFLDSPFAVHSSDGQSPFFQISGSGNVGIGTTSPVSTLHVLGNGNGKISVQ
ncbi:MAG: hypothetical protein HY738_20445, partial [Bacteroidia bacterium]|nr:hypothetical protein [Bacteroidia bacterium]